MAVIASSWLCWLIIAISFLCYERIINQLIDGTMSKGATGFCYRTFLSSQVLISVMIAVLPLMGLLGTIMGLLQCFMGMVQQGGQAPSFSDGIAMALVSTQLALVCVVPAFILNSILVARVQRFMTVSEVSHAN